MKNKKENEHRINRDILAIKVRLVGDNVENGEYEFRTAISIANDMGLDLVEISKNGATPICKIVDYQKFLYEKKKKEKETRKIQKQKQSELKEIRMTPNIDDHDFEFKLNHAKNFLRDGNKVLVSVFFKGREIVYQEKGKMTLLRFANELLDVGTAENMPKLEGKRMQMTIKNKK